jgi:protein-tyrosine phosphatase
VCRDLAIDLQRFKSLGVGALVCCLSDAELGVIGVQWEEYMKEAAKLGLDLVRVPMVEGNCPTSQEYLDAWLEEVVYHCTLKGINVLVHCRGGVGRAGTIAACWLAKMGLVDEFRPPNEVARRGKVLPGQELLWQCLQVVRMRRSSKAIETAEQAAYIAKYGEYLIAQWEKQHPGQEYLGAEYRDTVSSYWDRIRWETDEWVQQELREAEKRRNTDQSGTGTNGSESHQAASNGSNDANHHHSNIRSKSAAATPSKAAKGVTRPMPTTPKARAEGGSPLIKANTYPSPQGPLPQRKASLTNLSLPLTAQAPAPASASSGAGTDTLPANDKGRSDDGEPSRKRRNTASLSVDDMKLSDAEEPVAVSTILDKAADDCACDDDDDDDDDEIDIETELDAFPVNGRSGEGGAWSAGPANSSGPASNPGHGAGIGSGIGSGSGGGDGDASGGGADRAMPESSLFSGDEAVGLLR